MGSDDTVRASVVVRRLGSCVLLYSLTDGDCIWVDQRSTARYKEPYMTINKKELGWGSPK